MQPPHTTTQAAGGAPSVPYHTVTLDLQSLTFSTTALPTNDPDFPTRFRPCISAIADGNVATRCSMTECISGALSGGAPLPLNARLGPLPFAVGGSGVTVELWESDALIATATMPAAALLALQGGQPQQPLAGQAAASQQQRAASYAGVAFNLLPTGALGVASVEGSRSGRAGGEGW